MFRRKFRRRRHFWQNLRPATLLLLIPILISFVTFAFVGAGLWDYHLARQAANRLQTHDWKVAQQAMLAAEPTYQQKFAYYKIKPGQTVLDIADLYGITASQIEKDNEGTLLPGVTIKVRPLERPLEPISSSSGLAYVEVLPEADVIRIKNSFTRNLPVRATLPELAERLAAYDALEEVEDGTYRLNRAISIEGDIRIDITGSDLKRLELVSTPDDIAPLMFKGSSVLFDNVTVTTVDPSSGRPDGNSEDGRAFVRMINGRLDALNSTFSWLGNGLPKDVNARAKVRSLSFMTQGGTYGFSHRTTKTGLGVELTTGWIEGSTFENNHFGAYTFGTSGMMWKDNLFTYNEVYGLDPHDDSNNAMIVGNRFLYNGKHGFIVSKRCNYNVIRNNTSVGNKLHGFMLHQDSAYNLIENNVAYGNVDNYVIFHSNWNAIRKNASFVPKSSHVRINDFSYSNYVQDNEFYGGRRGVFLYDSVGSTFVGGNVFDDVRRPIQTKGATYTFFGENTTPSFNYDIAQGDKFIFGENEIDRGTKKIPTAQEVESGSFATGG